MKVCRLWLVVCAFCAHGCFSFVGCGGEGSETVISNDASDDTEDDGEDVFDDSGDGDSHVTVGELKLFESCKADGGQYCSLPAEACREEFTLSDGSGTVDLQAFAPNYPRFDDEGTPLGICAAQCNGADGNGADGSSAGRCDPDLEALGYRCMLVAMGNSSYPEGGARGEHGFPILVEPSERTEGTPYLALCVRPPDVGEPPLCMGCDVDSDCDGGICASDDHLNGFCTVACGEGEGCPVGFKCETYKAQGTYCLPVEDTCSSCVDRDNDGYGVGTCEKTPGGFEGLDCDDMDPETFFRGDINASTGAICEANRDRDCDGMEDAEEYSGPDAPNSLDNCFGCGMGCPDLQVDETMHGYASCGRTIVGEPTCKVACEPGFANCDGNGLNGCETDLSLPEHCGGCDVNCQEGATLGVGDVRCVPNTFEYFPEGTCTSDMGAENDYRCKVGDVNDGCQSGTADCNGCFSDGCEVDILSDDSHCGECGFNCNIEGMRYNAGKNYSYLVCESGDCVRDGDGSNPTQGCVANYTSLYADCDSNPSNGCEQELRSSEQACGGCGGTPCATGEVCALGECTTLSCEIASFKDCDGLATNACEADTRTVEFCGGCDTYSDNETWVQMRDAHCDGLDLNLNSNIVQCPVSSLNDDTDESRRLAVQCATVASSKVRQFRCEYVASETNASSWMSASDFQDYLDEGMPIGDETYDCGRCGNTCPVETSCVGGECKLIGDCPVGSLNCDEDESNGCEEDVTTKYACGSCPEFDVYGDIISTCPTEDVTSSRCVLFAGEYMCDFECQKGRADCIPDDEMCTRGQECFGCETALSSANHCGACGHACEQEHDDNIPTCTASTDEGSGTTNMVCSCTPSQDDLYSNSRGVEVQKESCDGYADTCRNNADEGCPNTLEEYAEGQGALVYDAERIYAPTGRRKLPRGRFEPTDELAVGDGYSGRSLMLKSLTLYNHNETGVGDNKNIITAIKASYYEVPVSLEPSGSSPEGAGNENFDYYNITFDSANTSANTFVAPQNIFQYPMGTTISCDQREGFDWTALEGTTGYADVSGGWAPIIVGFLIKRAPIYPDEGCNSDSEFSSSCGIGLSAPSVRGSCDPGWGGVGSDVCGHGLFCRDRPDSKPNFCALPVLRDSGGHKLKDTLVDGGYESGEAAMHCFEQGDITVGLAYDAPSGQSAANYEWCDKSGANRNYNPTSLMYDGIVGIRPLCASMRVVEVDSGALIPTKRYKVEIAGSPGSPDEPRVSRNGFGALKAQTFPSLEPGDLIEYSISMFVLRDETGDIVLAPMSTIGFVHDGRDYPHASYAGGENQRYSEEEAADHVFWNMHANWWRFKDTPRPTP